MGKNRQLAHHQSRQPRQLHKMFLKLVKKAYLLRGLCNGFIVLPGFVISRNYTSSPQGHRVDPNDLHTIVYKESMSRIASQAMILTSAITCSTNASKMPLAGDLHGLALSSVVSLSVKPRTLLQFNLQVPSSTSSRLHQNEWFAIHLLPPTENSVHLVRNFSKGAKQVANITSQKPDNKIKFVTTPFKDLHVHEYIFSSQVYDPTYVQSPPDPCHSPYLPSNKSSHIAICKTHTTGHLNIPLLTAAERIFICKKDAVFQIGDHEIWVAEVKDILSHRDYHFENHNAKMGGLLFFNRSFHKLGAELSEPK